MMMFFANILFSIILLPSFHCYAEIDYIDFAAQHLISHDLRILKCFFVPQPKENRSIIKQILLGLINAEQEEINAALFRLNDLDIAQALYRAKIERGVKIICVLDWSAFADRAQKCDMIIEAGIPLYKYTSNATMHNKFFIFHKNIWDKCIVWTGSANMTLSGLTRNEENVIVAEDETLFRQYVKRFVELIDKTKKLDEARYIAQEKIKLTKPITYGFVPTISYNIHKFLLKSWQSLFKRAARAS